MSVSIVNSILKIDLDLSSSIFHTCGYKGFLTYVSILTFKKNKGDYYISPEDIESYSLLEKSQDFIYQLKKLENIGLVIKKGQKYTVTTKLNKWLHIAKVETPKSLTLGGTLHLELDMLYRLRNTSPKELENRIFLTISNAVRKGKSISRGFIELATAVSPKDQRKIENKYSDYIKSEDLFTPVNKIEQHNIKHIPNMRGRIDFTDKKITTACNEKKHCKVIQLGNKMVVDSILCGGFLKWKKPREKRDSLALNKSVLKRDEVCDWDSYRVHIDLEDGKSKRNQDLFNINDKRFSTWDMFNKYDVSNVTIINSKGEFLSFRDHFRKFYS